MIFLGGVGKSFLGIYIHIYIFYFKLQSNYMKERKKESSP